MNSDFKVECIFVDDGSDEYVEEWFRTSNLQTSYSFIKKENGGASSARNVGIEKAKGERIMFVDADDEIIPDKIESILQKDFDADIIISDLIYKKGDDYSVWKLHPYNKSDISMENVLDKLSQNGKLNGPVCKMINYNYLINSGAVFPENMIVGEDAVFFYRLLRNKPIIQYFPESTYIYHSELTSSKNRLHMYADGILNDYKTMYVEFLMLLKSLRIDDKTGNMLIKNKTEYYIKQIFDFLLDSVSYHLCSKNIKEKIKERVDLPLNYSPFIIRKCNILTRMEYFYIKNNSNTITIILNIFRKIYLRCKKVYHENNKKQDF
ncbi:Glycosyl transferase family 2 [Oribacterium sp. KHPX15]|nr:Glycosyl transferase family 2 [Oribacterium sp. KHPX15]